VADRIVDGVWRIRGSGVNAYLAETDEGPVLVDAGTSLDGNALRAALAEAGHQPGDLASILLTHHDPDHVGGLASLLEDADAPVHMHRLDAAAFTGEDPLSITRWKGLMQRVGRIFVPEADADVREFRDGDVVAGLEALHTPGHTPGHTAFLDRGRGVAFVGDLVWTPFGALRFMPGVMDDDPDLSNASLGSLVHRIPEDLDVVLPGHGRPVTDGGFQALADLAGQA
jgi:glyoxylase-like metal-dependent hydrolase (beta-lactamase superfamily II)